MIKSHNSRLEQLQNNWKDHVDEIKTLTVAIDKLEENEVLF